MMNNQTKKNVDYVELLGDVLSYLSSFINTPPINNIIKDALNILNKFPTSDSSAFFRMDNETFEFNFQSCLPESTNIFYSDSLEFLSTSGSIGMAMQSGRFLIVHQDSIDKWHFILPIFTSKNVLGFFVISSSEDLSSMGLQYINLLMIFARSFANAYENKELILKQNQSAELLDQLIASRTIELIENNHALGDKIESLKSNLSMSIPHEVRTPINEILGMTSYLKSIFSQYTNIPLNDKTEVMEIIEDIKTSANRLKNLFENFIYHTRLSIIATSLKELEQIQSQYCPYCESVIWEQAQLKAQYYLRENDLDINLVSANIKIGEEYLTKLVDELVDNAIKFSNTDTKISIFSSIESNYYSLTVYDNGEGIPPEFLSQIDAYVQFDRPKNEQQGLGLGLAIVYKIVDLHKGTINIESKVNEFTKVTVKLPISEDYYFD